MQQMSKLSSYIFIVLVLGFSSCKKQEIGPQCPTCVDENITVKYDDVLIGCEGNFGWGNASISLYNPTNTSITNTVFQNINGYPLGDVLQSMTEYNGKLFVVVNNSGNIEILDTATYQKTATISGLTSPRYFCGINNSQAYVSDLFSNQIAILDLGSNSVIGSINTGGWTEEMLLVNDKVYVCRPDTNFILQINASTNSIEDTIVVGKGPSSLVLDNNNKIWALSSGGINDEQAELNQIDPSTNSISKTMVFSDLSNSPNNLKISSNGETIYYLNNGVNQLSIYASSLPSSSIINQNGALFYGLGISPTNDIYVSDAVDYVQSGIVYRYDSTASLIHQFSVGIIPQGFWFK
jgi:hypothetical protein